MSQSSQPPEHASHSSTKPYEPVTTRDASRRPDLNLQQARTLPPVATLTAYRAGLPQALVTTDAGSPVAVRPFGVHSILNPATNFRSPEIPPRMSQSPSISASMPHGSQLTPLLSPRVRKRKDEASPRRASQTPSDAHRGRRMLTPKSPALRSLSSAPGASPSAGGSVGASRTNTSGRIYTAEPGAASGSAVPPLPIHDAFTPALYNPTPGHHQTAGTGLMSYPASTASYSAPAQGHYDSPSDSSYAAEREESSPFGQSASEPAHNSLGSQAPLSEVRATNRSYGVGQQSYQMQLSTDQGTMIVPVEVDVQQASKMADEKRKRNAGASARFRQRRKEKEQAAASSIGELQRQVRELTEERDFYLGERNFFRDMSARPQGQQIPPRPPSPHVRRAQTAGQFVGIRADQPSIDYERRDMSEPSPAQRRRTSDYTSSYGQPQIAPTNYVAGYPAPQVPALGPSYGLLQGTLPPPPQESQTHAPRSALSGSLGALPRSMPGQPPSLPPISRSHQYDILRRDPTPR